jgi:hypothetical protein
MSRILFILLTCTIISCNNSDTVEAKKDAGDFSAKRSFGDDLQFLRQYHKDLVVLGDSGGAQVIIAPAYQGRVMTSTTEGEKGLSFGWINHELIASGKPAEHINAFGGEERFWLGPEGGQFSIYFKKGVEFKFDNWFVPKEIDSEPFNLVSADDREAKFEKEIHLENYSGNRFDVRVQRDIHLLNRQAIDSALGISVPPAVQAVAFESGNFITNTGATTWDKKTGMLSIWILSMMNASEKTTVAVPYVKDGDTARLGPIVTDDYFGKVPADRLKINNGLILFKADASHRSKIGISPKRALPLAGSYDATNNVLTVAQFSLHEGVVDYVNSLWKIQDNPFRGDAVNSYNDGPIDGKQMGKFYEVESSSPAAALAPGKTLYHMHRTIHLKGNKEDLDKIAMKLFGVGVDQIKL